VYMITISQLNSSIQQLVGMGSAVKNDNVYKINLSELGFDKLLGTGKPLYTFEIVVAKATDSAIKKIEEKGGSVLLLAQPESDSSDELAEE
jgi:large subunit ribosomal protein L15